MKGRASSPPPSSTTTKRQSSPPYSDPRRRRPAAHQAARPAPPAHTADEQPASPPQHPASAGRVQYGLPPLPTSMNPNYPPPHHSTYIPPQHYPPHPHHPVGTNAGPIPGMYPYAITHHPPPYAHHPYPGYHHQYAPLGPGGFSLQRPPDVPQPSPQPAHASVASGNAAKGIKRKRKSEDRTKPEDDIDGADVKKRTKTQRACDSCRSRKIRCDVLPEIDPPQCQHCKQYGFDCTFFLPITETRFKKKRLEEEAAAAAAAAAAADKNDAADSAGRTGTPKSDALAKAEPKVLGPTSAAFLLHSTATVPTRAYENYDLRYYHTWEVSKSGDSFIQVAEPNPPSPAPALSRSPDLRIERDVVERLVNSYFNDIAPIFTVVSRDEFLSSPSPPPILLYAICSVAAAKRDVPPAVFNSLRTAVGALIKAEDVLSTASTVNLQALLVLGMCADCHSPFVSNALSAFWLRLGTAVRMAQDLGLHRAESVKQNLDLRRRLWAACVISDRWCSLTYGHPFMIDVEDCDVRLTSSEAVEDMYMNELLKLSILLGRVLKMIYSPSGLVLATDAGLETLLADLDTWNASLPPILQYTSPASPMHAGLLRLFYTCVTMLFWRVFMRISYTVPAHLKFALTVERWSRLVGCSRECIEWMDCAEHEGVYEVWMLVSYCATSCALVQYHTWARRQDPEAAATLRKLRDCVKRWEATLPPDHRSTRRKTAEIIALLYESTQTPLAAITAGPAPSSNVSNPTAAISTAAAASSNGASSTTESSASHVPSPINPTVGVRPRTSFPEALRGLTFRKDPSQPGGGVFVARERESGDYSDLPRGSIVLREGVGSDISENAGGTSTPATLVNYTPLTALNPPSNPGAPNVNPTLNTHRHAGGAPHVQVMNVLDSPLPMQGVGAGTEHEHSLKPPSHPSATSAHPSHAAATAHPTTHPAAPSSQPTANTTTATATNPTTATNTSSRTAPPTTSAASSATAAAFPPITDTPLLERLAQFAATDNGLLEGIPGGMFDWDRWDLFFARFGMAAGTGMGGIGGASGAGAMQALAQAGVQAQANAQAHAQAQAHVQANAQAHAQAQAQAERQQARRASQASGACESLE